MAQTLSLLIILSCLPFFAFAVPLTEDALRSAGRVGVYTGAFDPWNAGDEAAARAMMSSGKYDLVVILPTDERVKDVPLPVSNRLRLIGSSLANDPTLSYPLGKMEKFAQDPAHFLIHIQSINPNAVITKNYALKATVPDIREHLFSHPELYQNAEAAVVPDGQIPSVFKNILRDGLYMGRAPNHSSMTIKRMMSRVATLASKAGLSDRFRKLAGKILSRPGLKEYKVGNDTYKVDRYLASGINGDAYLTTINDKSYVLKVAKTNDHAHNSMRQAGMVHEYLRRTSTITIPDLISADATGNYTVMELVKGQSLDKFIASHNGVIPTETEKRLQAFFKETARINGTSAMGMDISGDNIFIRDADGAVVLVDFGPTRPDNKFVEDYASARKRWIDSSALIKRAPAGDCVRNVLRSLMTTPR